MKKYTILFISTAVLFTAGSLCFFFWKKIMETKVLYRLNEPMLISNAKGAPYYMIPTNTVMQFQKGYPEGHQLYTIEVFFKGELPAGRVASNHPTESTWLYQLDAEDVSKVLNQYPLSKGDLVQILKARKVTRDDLAQIVREWKEE